MSARETLTSLSNVILTNCEPIFTRRPDIALIKEFTSLAITSMTFSLNASVAVSEMLSSIILSAIS